MLSAFWIEQLRKIIIVTYQQEAYKMNEKITRHIKINDWIFEVKMVKAIRVENYGEPYSAVANINLNGNNAYIDGMMQKNLLQISTKDIAAIEQYCDKMSIDDITFDTQAPKLHSSPLFSLPTG